MSRPPPSQPSAAARPRAPSSDWRPWSQAWIERLQVEPAWAGLAFAVAHVLVGSSVYLTLAGDRTRPEWSTGWDALGAMLVFALLIGYAPAALAYARRGHRATLEDLQPALHCSNEDRARARREIECFEARLLRPVGVAAAAGAVCVTLFTTGLIEELGPWDPWLAWVVWQNVLAFWLTSRTMAHDLRVSWLLSRWTEQWAEVEILDPTPLAPLARRGLQSALVIILATSIITFVYGLGNLSPAVPVLQVLTIGLAGLAVLLPSVGVHRKLRTAKREELARLAGEIRATRCGAPDAAELATLLTLRQHVEAARLWPFDMGTLGRFALYAAIGLGSWFGGAIVERLLDIAIG